MVRVRAVVGKTHSQCYFLKVGSKQQFASSMSPRARPRPASLAPDLGNSIKPNTEELPKSYMCRQRHRARAFLPLTRTQVSTPVP